MNTSIINDLNTNGTPFLIVECKLRSGVFTSNKSSFFVIIPKSQKDKVSGVRWKQGTEYDTLEYQLNEKMNLGEPCFSSEFGLIWDFNKFKEYLISEREEKAKEAEQRKLEARERDRIKIEKKREKARERMRKNKAKKSGNKK